MDVIQITNTVKPEMKILYFTNSKNLYIENSYQIKNNSDKKTILEEANEQIKQHGYIFNRTINSQLYEWRGHNALYKMHIAQSRSQSVDINEGETLIRRIGYRILSILE